MNSRTIEAMDHHERNPHCDVPPEGWTCSRTKGHEGPCAASPAGRGMDATEAMAEILRLKDLVESLTREARQLAFVNAEATAAVQETRNEASRTFASIPDRFKLADGVLCWLAARAYIVSRPYGSDGQRVYELRRAGADGFFVRDADGGPFIRAARDCYSTRDAALAALEKERP